MTKKQILARIKKIEQRIMKDRDNIRELIYYLEDLEGDCQVASDELSIAADTLSKYL